MCSSLINNRPEPIPAMMTVSVASTSENTHVNTAINTITNPKMVVINPLLNSLSICFKINASHEVKLNLCNLIE